MDYQSCWDEMRRFTEERDPTTADEIWFVQHDPVFTLGMNADTSHVLDPGDIPVVQIDRGGQVTYHGPGQLLVYPLIDVRRLKMGVRELVCGLENTVIGAAAEYGIEAYGRRDAPGVYVGEKKLAAVGLRIRRGSSYHGMAVNVNMDLTPYQRINPCGFSDLAVTQLADLCDLDNVDDTAKFLEPLLLKHLRLGH